MNRMLYSNYDFSDMRKRINQEVLRRATYWWWDPLCTPRIGVDRHNPESLPLGMDHISVDDRTYTINTPSDGALFETKNTQWKAHGSNPGGQDPSPYEVTPSTSASRFTSEEIKNFIIGLVKIRDINLFYGRDEKPMTAFREPLDLYQALLDAESDVRNEPRPIANNVKMDPNGRETRFHHPGEPTEFYYANEHGFCVMESGEFDGEEITSRDGQLGPDNYYDDYGAAVGESDYHPYNHFVSAITSKFIKDAGNHRDDHPIVIKQGGRPSTNFGPNPRNPNPGDPYKSYPVYQGKAGSCQVACTGLCSMTCDEQCSESCTVTCHGRCGEACFEAGTLIETDQGPVPIEEIKVGDMVLTQSGEYHRVYDTFKRLPELSELIHIKIHGAELHTTINHPIWAKRYLDRKMVNRFRFTAFAEPEWIPAGDLRARDRAQLLWKKAGDIHVEPAVAYMVGRWLGDGWVEHTVRPERNYSISTSYWVCCGYHDSDKLEKIMDDFGIRYGKYYSQTTTRYRILKLNEDRSINEISSMIIEYVSQCGEYARWKTIPQCVYKWDIESIQWLLRGYFGSDGHYDPSRGVAVVSSVSKKLIYGIMNLLRICGYNCSYTQIDMSKRSTHIQGRRVNIHQAYSISIYVNQHDGRTWSEFDEKCHKLWSVVRTPKAVNEPYWVYNISVEGDHSYYADGVLVHNCTSTCGNICTGCSSLCLSSCRTKCETHAGYSCVNAGAVAVKITSTGGHDGIPAKNVVEATYHKCEGCSYSCQFYPNKKTDCWDAGCAGKCFVSCASGCSESCFGGCIDNKSENIGDYKQGVGRGCMNGCTINCIGGCSGVCEGDCVDTCFMSCRQQCSDDCAYTCATDCGSGCFQGCKDGCTSCTDQCDTSCTGEAIAMWRTCSEAGCTGECQFGCDRNCMAEGCKNICGTEGAGACTGNCRMNCTGTSCTSKCENACSGECTTCVNTCNSNCGACESECSTACGGVCNITCSGECENSCAGCCNMSCAGQCSGCSSLCYSCVGKCIGVCSVKCEDGCSNCSLMCSWWCDVNCNQACFADCSSVCISTCSGSCITTVTSSAKMAGPDRGPTAEGYPWKEPKDRKEEQASFQIWRDPQDI